MGCGGAHAAFVIQSQPGFTEVNADHAMTRVAGLSLSSLTFAVNSTVLPRTTWPDGPLMLTVGALLMGSVKSKHPESPSRAKHAQCKRQGWRDRPTGRTLSQLPGCEVRPASRTLPCARPVPAALHKKSAGLGAGRVTAARQECRGCEEISRVQENVGESGDLQSRRHRPASAAGGEAMLWKRGMRTSPRPRTATTGMSPSLTISSSFDSDSHICAAEVSVDSPSCVKT